MGSFQDIQGATEWQKAESRKFKKDLHVHSFQILQKSTKEGRIYEKP